MWAQFISQSKANTVTIIAFSYGGQVTMDLAKKFPGYFLTRVTSVHLIDSAHIGLTDNTEVDKHLQEIGCNYVASTQPTGTRLEGRGRGLSCVSAGHIEHGWTPWHSMELIFQTMLK